MMRCENMQELKPIKEGKVREDLRQWRQSDHGCNRPYQLL